MGLPLVGRIQTSAASTNRKKAPINSMGPVTRAMPAAATAAPGPRRKAGLRRIAKYVM